ncbi:MAG: 30S ribosomal protein S11 [Epsilonproteobacteria bacterium]|nr:MAG: 30S ribosomal protein S11 [Campylobacterota bacterium]RLA66492.1 MAG: 30S ribosomal protein S11 [Campylobacterota bacterium]
MAKKIQKKKVKKNIAHGICHVQASFNNTIVTFTDPKGNALSWASAGQLGFRGSKKSTPFAAQQASAEAARRAAEHGVTSVDVLVKGPGAGRENAIRALIGAGIKICSVADNSPIPHNGCRAPKRRRV